MTNCVPDSHLHYNYSDREPSTGSLAIHGHYIRTHPYGKNYRSISSPPIAYQIEPSTGDEIHGHLTWCLLEEKVWTSRRYRHTALIPYCASSWKIFQVFKMLYRYGILFIVYCSHITSWEYSITFVKSNRTQFEIKKKKWKKKNT